MTRTVRPREPEAAPRERLPVQSAEQLRQLLFRLDRRPFPAYRDIEGIYQLAGFTLAIDRVQADPFAAPSRVRAIVPRDTTALPEDTYATALRRVALGDFLAREFSHQAALWRGRRSSIKMGAIAMEAPGQEILD